MPITSLHINNFRNLATAELEPSPGLNVIYGNNGSGKTSLLEAIHYLGRGRSFRSTSIRSIIRHSTEKFSIFAKLLSDLELRTPIGVERNLRGEVKLRIADRDIASMLELALLLPIRLINSQSHNIFESGPIFRRKYLDWGLFYQFDEFLPCWRQFERALKQRNAVLRDNRSSKHELAIWTEELAKYGLQIDHFRREYIQILSPIINEIAEALLSLGEVAISYQSGWDEGEDYLTVLTKRYLDEIRFGCTQYGPHRADFDLRIKGFSSRHFLSRGQQKLLICAIIMAQGKLLVKGTNKGLIYLVDDLPAELDLQSRQRLIALLPMQESQVFITAIESETIYNLVKPNMPKRLFHVEQGKVLAVSDNE